MTIDPRIAIALTSALSPTAPPVGEVLEVAKEVVRLDAAALSAGDAYDACKPGTSWVERNRLESAHHDARVAFARCAPEAAVILARHVLARAGVDAALEEWAAAFTLDEHAFIRALDRGDYSVEEVTRSLRAAAVLLAALDSLAPAVSK